MDQNKQFSLSGFDYPLIEEYQETYTNEHQDAYEEYPDDYELTDYNDKHGGFVLPEFR